MIEFEIKQNYYKEIHNAITAVDNKCLLNFSKDGLKITLVDPANVLMGSIEIDKSVFESFIGVDETIGYQLDFFGDKDELDMFLESPTNHKFNFYNEGGLSRLKLTHDIFIDEITLPGWGNFRRQPRILAINSSCFFDLPVSILKKIIKRGEFFRFVVEDNHLICDGESDELKWHTEPMRINPTKDAVAMYSIDYMEAIVTAIPDTIDTVKISMGTNYPVSIEFNICDGKVPVKYLLAPRIESE